ncbi:alpha/beta fold hydrolase [Celeribacter sp.]|uniref:alpha/beta fold hydrolase n=1 Tax=Celeribacter sp. TaxID=1890673 RepID=UPI003A94E84E
MSEVKDTVILKMPRLGETMEEGTVSDWLLAEGESFERGAPLIEFETDKTAVEYPALGRGKLVRTLVSKGDIVRLGEPIAQIDLLGGEDWVSGEDDSAEPAVDEPQQSDTVVIDLLMPRLGETMEEGKIMGWMVEVGAQYERGAAILEVETDKTVAEFPALVAGRLVETLVASGETVKVDTPIARVEVARADAPDLAPDTQEEQSTTAQIAAAKDHAPAVARVGSNVRATPLARRAARRAGLAIESLNGSGRRGRIELVDVERAIARGGVGLPAQTWGPADGTPVLLVHGFAGDSVTFDQLGKGLARAGLSVRAVDLPGHGANTAEAQRFDDLVDALAAELDPARPVHLVGHSLGAAAVIAAVAKQGGALSLSLIAPAGLGLSIDAEFITGMAHADSRATIGHLLRRLSRRAESFSEDIVSEIYASLSTGRLVSLADDICRNGHQTVNLRSAVMRLASELPVRILLGQQDQILDWRDAIDVSPEIALHVFPEAGHMPHWDEPEVVKDILQRGFNNE